jgi:predicted TIM-barrel fold metal-dependent hydrolase
MAIPQLDAERKTSTGRAIIDCDFHNELDSEKDLYPYLSQRWRDHIDTYGIRSYSGGYYPRFMDHRAEACPPSGRRAGSEVEFSRERFLDRYGIAYAILNPLTPVSRSPHLDLDAALATAVNDWQVAEWLDKEPRLRASMVIPFEDPPRAVAEIDRRAGDKRFVQVLFTGRPREPMGRRKYWPIYEACGGYGLHVASHAFGSAGNPITGAGHPSYYIEEHIGPPQAMQANITSMVVEGVFERFPALKLVSVENGFGWVPALMWRLDSVWKLLRSEVPHLKRLPSEVIREHLYLSTQPMEEPPRSKPRYFEQLLEHFGYTDRLLFASDYPHWDADSPEHAVPAYLSDEVKRRIFFENARGLYDLP